MDKRIKAESAFAFSQLREDDLEKIPNHIRDEIVLGFDEEIFNRFDSEKPFTEQNLSEEALEILSDIFDEND